MSGVQTDSDIQLIRDRALFVREETIRLISIAKTGHYASAFSAAEIIAALYYGVMRLRRGEPEPELPGEPDQGLVDGLLLLDPVALHLEEIVVGAEDVAVGRDRLPRSFRVQGGDLGGDLVTALVTRLGFVAVGHAGF